MKNTGLVYCGVAIAVGLLTLGSAFAQEPGGGPPGPFGGPPGRFGGPFGGPGARSGSGMLAMIPEVQTELKLTDEQENKLAGMQQQAQQQMRQAFQQVREKAESAAPEERPQIFEQIRKTMDDLQAQQAKQIGTVLTADQQKRLKEIGYQQQGNMALADPQVAGELKLTDDQKAYLQNWCAIKNPYMWDARNQSRTVDQH